ncbi:hypothetical protein ACFL5J_02770 [Thermodesulfobacteriota bacterium]
MLHFTNFLLYLWKFVHAELLAKGHKLAEECKVSTLTVGDVFQFLAYEVVNRHMLETDREFFPFINQASANPEGEEDKQQGEK